MVKILSDSTCDLSPALISRYNIGIIPLHVHLGEKEYKDGVDITPEDLYRWPDMDEICSYLDRDGRDEYVIFTISSTMSSSCSNCLLTARELGMSERVFVIDSASLSTGIGLLVIRAAIMAEKGMSGSEIAAEIEKVKGKVRASFVVDTLTYLYRGGRCSGVSAFFGSALHIHPRIAVVDGSMHPEKKYRGNTSRCIMNYVRDMEEDLKNAAPERVFITHSGCDRKTLDEVKSYLEGLNHFEEILETRAGSVISSHCGPGTLGVLFIAG